MLRLLLASLICWSTSVMAADPLKVAFVYVSPVGDVGWTYSHDEGRRYLEQMYGANIETKIVESVPEGREAREVFERLAEEGNDIIFTTSWGYMVSSQRTASMYPNVKFEHATGLRRGDNLSTYSTRAYEARYLSGVIAGRMTKSNRVGYVAAYPVAEIIRGINAFTLGVRSVNPNAVVDVQWTKSWYAPAVANKITHKLIDDGADIVTQHIDSPTPVKVAEARGVYAIGYHSDMSKFGSRAHLLSVTHNWGKIYAQRVAALQSNQWSPKDLWPGLKEGTSKLTSISPIIPASILKEVEAIKAGVISGEQVIFAGPINNTRGRTKVRDGRALSDDELLRMNWFVEGTIGDTKVY